MMQQSGSSGGGGGGGGGGKGGGGGGGKGGGGGLSQAEVKYLADKVSFAEKSVERLQKLGESVESRMGGAISSAGFGRTAKKFQAAVRKATMGITRAWSQLYLFVIILLVLFLFHQVTLALATSLSTHARAHQNSAFNPWLQICAALRVDRRGPGRRV